MSLADNYLKRTQMLLRLSDPQDLGRFVAPEARREILRVLEPAPVELPYIQPRELVSEFAEDVQAEVE